ncbi:hypothetical protein GBF35_25910 [Nonomuraea phyllanthi]|uniref:hypothetical protein n=1 Tax=Nonomuraea phyllanthi TaxID=2219224 RepID=UPI001292D65D|nr:hypothetical protein [Nonomuraea phyllanthi]QFY09631.1 hypothetical protein GBF35_25910 [Nonomuraea phyllanthi]
MEPMSSLSREFLYVYVEGATGNEAVEMAFTAPDAKPIDTDWRTAEWGPPQPDGADAKILVGPGDGAVPLPAGTHLAWVRVTAVDEQPVLSSGLVPIT